MKKTVGYFIALVFIASEAASQKYELRVLNKGNGVLGVDMRLVAGTSPSPGDYVMDIVFGVKWNNTLPADLSNTISSTFNIKKSGPRAIKDSFYYQAFYIDPAGFNFPAWQMNNTWVEVMAVKGVFNSPAIRSFEICEPGFDGTTDPNIKVNNVDYTPAVNGKAALSVTRPESITATAGAFKLQPNPAFSVLQLLLTDNNTVGKQRLRVIDVKGLVMKESFFDYAGGNVVHINVSALSKGQYYVVIDQNDHVLYSEPFQKR